MVITELPKFGEALFTLPNKKDIPLRPNADWSDDVPKFEPQTNFEFDTFSCCTYASVHALCTLAKAKFGVEWNKSERFTAIMSGTVKDKGNSIRQVVSAMAKFGVVDQADCPFPDEMTEDQYFAPIPLTTQFKGRDWLNQYELDWQWVSKFIGIIPTTNKDMMYEALKYSPLVTSVDSNSPESNGVIQNQIEKYNHAKYIKSAVYGVSWTTEDSYDGSLNTYAWDYEFFHPIKFTLELKKKSFWDLFSDLLSKF